MAKKQEVMRAGLDAIKRGTWKATGTTFGTLLFSEGETSSDTYEIAFIVTGDETDGPYSCVLVNNVKTSNKRVIEILSTR